MRGDVRMLTILSFIVIFATDGNYCIVKTIIALMAVIIDLVWIYSKVHWLEITKDSTPKLTFKQFIRIYNAMPDKFTLHQVYVSYISDGHFRTINMKSGFDLLKYEAFYRKRKKYDKQMERLKVQADLIKAIQEDLNKQQEEITDFVKEKSVL